MYACICWTLMYGMGAKEVSSLWSIPFRSLNMDGMIQNKFWDWALSLTGCRLCLREMEDSDHLFLHSLLLIRPGILFLRSWVWCCFSPKDLMNGSLKVLMVWICWVQLELFCGTYGPNGTTHVFKIPLQFDFFWNLTKFLVGLYVPNSCNYNILGCVWPKDFGSRSRKVWSYELQILEVEVGKYGVMNSTLCLAQGTRGPTTKKHQFILYQLLSPWVPGVHKFLDFITLYSHYSTSYPNTLNDDQ